MSAELLRRAAARMRWDASQSIRASWTPAATLAVADWLDADAAVLAASEEDSFDNAYLYTPAIAVARVYLDEQP